MRRTLMAGVVAAALIGVAGCGADDPRPRIAEPTTTATDPSDPTSAPTAEPDFPVEATRANRAGAVAFTRYFWDLINAAQVSGDTSALQGLVAATCETCQAGIESIRTSTKGDREVRGGAVSLSNVRAQPVPSSAGFVVSFDATNTAQELLRGGEVVERFAPDTISSRFLLAYTDQSWRIDIWRIRES